MQQKQIVKQFVLRVTSLMLMLILLAGCAAFEPAASIRVEVDVYKGPLSKPVNIQIAELKGIYDDTIRSLRYYQESIEENIPCFNGSTPNSIYMMPNGTNCLIVKDFHKRANKLETNLSVIKFNEKLRKESLREKLIELTVVGAQMKVQSAAAASELISYIPSSERVRIAQNAFSVLTSEYGNLLLSRADTLMLQIFSDDNKNGHGIDGKQLHLNKYLADSNPTQAPKLLEWFNSKAPTIAEEWKYLIPGYNPSMESRVRVYEELFNDALWSNVNTVYASGMGDVSMALIRDDIGNWNLKNFDNDPAELLSAYKDVALEGLKAAAKLASTGATGGTAEAAKLAAQMVNQLTTPVNATSVPIIPINAARQKIVNRIEEIKTKSQNEWDNKKCNEQSKTADEPTEGTSAADSTEAEKTKEECNKIAKQASEQLRNILYDYSIILDTLQEVNVTSEKS